MTQEPDARVAMLNEELSDVGDIGSFRLVHTVRISAALEVEQASFQVLERFRVLIGVNYLGQGYCRQLRRRWPRMLPSARILASRHLRRFGGAY